VRQGNSNRVGLDFEAVKLAPVEVFGLKAGALPPLNFNFPRIKTSDLPGVDPATAPGFFDVLYLDKDMLIIKQNAPGGCFCFYKSARLRSLALRLQKSVKLSLKSNFGN